MSASYQKLLSLKAEFKTLTSVDWSPTVVIPEPGATAIIPPEASGSTKRKDRPRCTKKSHSFIGGVVTDARLIKELNCEHMIATLRDGSVYMGLRAGIVAGKDHEFPEWYRQVI